MTDARRPAAVTFRPLSAPEELPLFRRLTYVLDHELADDLAAGRRRPEWLWVALDGAGRVVARLAWWTGAPGGPPRVLDILDFLDGPARPGVAGVPDGLDALGRHHGPAAAGDPAEVAVRLLETATARVVPAGAPRPEYTRFVPPDWRTDPAARAVVAARTGVVERTGARLLVERLRLEWRSGAPEPEPTGRLVFRGVRDGEELVALMARVMDGTLDAHGRADLASGLSPRAAAEKHYTEELARYRTPRAWWRIAELPEGGGPVGFVIPARNNYHPIIAYLGVLPEHRGRGYIDEILAEGTRVLAAEGVHRIRAATDLGNVPMARAFARAGYVNFERQVDYVWPAG
ncbi:GNAT family N-acetyltransferase [Streptomyces sp. LP05-1]|uniref:GNAT family N-acetyltransferase n=1 Tax=Streptomyces pyxinae TaxID=2970734 RepID=A0ABT2CFH2_9ACTN|nr:GNAT family N-acetyltransferase [Streptomyces sp. LP05-1]MCS0635476.1 GNAT family N-acetyltransferase [Streptomyces sp. LP05-1]